jgi:ABC-type bacteriocin/lantibiotic exporter with double-glycine peptidase domain
MELKSQKTLKTLRELIKLLSLEKQDFFVFIAYAVISSLLYLAVPVSAQILVNTIAANVLIQPLILISLLLLVTVTFLSLVRIIKLYITEILQRKVFAKFTMKIAEKLPEVSAIKSNLKYLPELTNRFFDVIGVQKSISTLLTEIPTAVLQILGGLLLIAFYSPILLFFDTLLIVSIVLIIILGRNAVKTSIDESSEKYSVAYWLEETARCVDSIKMNDGYSFFINKTDSKILEYLNDRSLHFGIVLNQYIASLTIQGIAAVSVLAIGGWLVLEGKLSLGQLIASEVIILIVLNALEKISLKLEDFYDLLTSLYKLCELTEISVEKNGKNHYLSNDSGAVIEFKSVNFFFDPVAPVLKNINFKLEPASRNSLVGRSGSGKSTIANLIAGMYLPVEGKVFINNQSTDGINLRELRAKVALINNSGEIFDGTVEENITFGKPYPKEKIQEVLTMAMMQEDVKLYKQGLQSRLMSDGKNISRGQRQRILIARAIISDPDILILDEVFGTMSEFNKMQILENLFAPTNKWTVLNISHDTIPVLYTDNIIVIEDGVILEKGLIRDLYNNQNSEFKRLFPKLNLDSKAGGDNA